MTPTPPESVKNGQTGWEEYIKQRRAYFADKEIQYIKLVKRLDKERLELSIKHKEERNAVLKGSWRRFGLQLNAMRSVLAAEQAAETADQRQRQKCEREELRKRYPLSNLLRLAEEQSSAAHVGT